MTESSPLIPEHFTTPNDNPHPHPKQLFFVVVLSRFPYSGYFVWMEIQCVSQVMLVLKNLRANAGDVRDLGSFDPWVGKIPWRRAWKPTPVFLPGESSCLEGGGAWQAIVHRVTQSRMWLKQLIMCTYSFWLLCLACLYFQDSSLCSTINTYFPFSGCILFYHLDILFLFICSSVDDYLGFLFSLKCMSEWVSEWVSEWESLSYV